MKAIASLVVLALFSATASANVVIDLVTVGNPGNAPDTRYNGMSVGSVDHVFQMGKYEITAGQYTEFLNAVAKFDPHGLYNENMSKAEDFTGGANIQRTGVSGHYVYTVANDWAKRPVNYAGFWDAVRFANWLSNGQPTGDPGQYTTEDGAYHDLENPIFFGRYDDAKFFLPTENEWYKAAYYNNSPGVAASYFDFPTGTNSAPLNTLPDPGNHANYWADFTTPDDIDPHYEYTIGAPYYRTEVGAFVNSASPYGTYDQGGNVWELTETRPSNSTLVVRGGAFGDYQSTMLASYRVADYPILFDAFGLGFRIGAAIPEPSTGLLIATALVGLFPVLRRHMNRRGRRHPQQEALVVFN